MKKFIIEIETDDDFGRGCCCDCPLHDYTDDKCSVWFVGNGCPLVEVIEE